MMISWLLRPYYRHATRRATCRMRNRRLNDWCDYDPAHRGVAWETTVDGVLFGQSCFKHLGALMLDSLKDGGQMTMNPVEKTDRIAEVKALTKAGER